MLLPHLSWNLWWAGREDCRGTCSLLVIMFSGFDYGGTRGTSHRWSIPSPFSVKSEKWDAEHACPPLVMSPGPLQSRGAVCASACFLHHVFQRCGNLWLEEAAHPLWELKLYSISQKNILNLLGIHHPDHGGTETVCKLEYKQQKVAWLKTSGSPISQITAVPPMMFLTMLLVLLPTTISFSWLGPTALIDRAICTHIHEAKTSEEIWVTET